MQNNFIQVPPDGSGKKIFTSEHVVDGESVQVQKIQLIDKYVVDNNLSIDRQGAAFTRFAEGQPILSAFGILKNAEERALGVYEASLSSYDDLFDILVSSGGDVIYNPEESSEVLSVTSGQGSSVSMTTNRYHYYLPGTSNVAKMTISCGDNGKNGNVRRWGLFDNDDGLFFELHNDQICVVIRSSTSGQITENRVFQNDWNSDKIDGSGLSELSLDVTKINIYWIDYQWLGAGRVRFGIFDKNGQRVVCHVFEHAGSVTLPYMRTGTLPLKAENYNNLTTGSFSELRAICLSVYMEGNYEDYTFWRYSDAEIFNLITNTNTHAFSLKVIPEINNKYNTAIVYPETLNVYCNNPVSVTIWQGTEISNPNWEELSSALNITHDGVLNLEGAIKFKTIFFDKGAHSFNLGDFFEMNDEGIQRGIASEGIWSITATRLTLDETTTTINLGYKELW